MTLLKVDYYQSGENHSEEFDSLDTASDFVHDLKQAYLYPVQEIAVSDATGHELYLWVRELDAPTQPEAWKSRRIV